MCGLEFPDLETEFWQRYRDQGLVVVGLSGPGLYLSESWGSVNQFREQTGVTFPLLLLDDTRGEYANDEGSISPYPVDVVVDREGIVRYLRREYDPAAMGAVIESLLAEPVKE